MAGRGAPKGARYVDQRPYVVPETLADLRGPIRGVVVLDRRLDWSGRAEYDLGKPRRLASMYETVLREASSPGELARWLDERKLIELWPDLVLPQRLRASWEARFPQLVSARGRAA
jgi:hypothetical protein